MKKRDWGFMYSMRTIVNNSGWYTGNLQREWSLDISPQNKCNYENGGYVHFLDCGNHCMKVSGCVMQIDTR